MGCYGPEMNNGESGLEFANDTSEMLWYYGGCRPLTFNEQGGTLHGWWGTYSMDVTSSDRRLKENIRPVFETLQAKTSWDGNELNPGAAVDAVLEQLRPVSYNLRSEGNSMRVGFVADEMLRVLPEVTRVTKNSERTMGILYQDLLAVLTTRMQGMLAEMDGLTARLKGIEGRIAQRRLWRTGRRHMMHAHSRKG